MKGESEIDLCARLRTWGESLGFTVYPEVEGWDLVFVSDQDRKLGGQYSNQIIVAGKQVGIHAKLRASFEVLAQAVYERGAHPAYPFVAVPVAGRGFEYIARKLGVGVIEASVKSFYADKERIRVREWLNNPAPDDRHQLPLPPVASRCISAGSPSPRVLSQWRVKALRFLVHARAKGTVTASELTGFGISKSWVDRWLEPVDWTTETRRGKQVRVRTYRLVTNAEKLPDWGYADVAAELLAAEPMTDVVAVVAGETGDLFAGELP